MEKYFLIILFTFVALCGICSAKEITFTHEGQLFKLINPSVKDGTKKPLLLLLHGCKQNSEMIANGTGLWDEAMKRKFFLLVPEQTMPQKQQELLLLQEEPLPYHLLLRQS